MQYIPLFSVRALLNQSVQCPSQDVLPDGFWMPPLSTTTDPLVKSMRGKLGQQHDRDKLLGTSLTLEQHNLNKYSRDLFSTKCVKCELKQTLETLGTEQSTFLKIWYYNFWGSTKGSGEPYLAQTGCSFVADSLLGTTQLSIPTLYELKQILEPLGTLETLGQAPSWPLHSLPYLLPWLQRDHC